MVVHRSIASLPESVTDGGKSWCVLWASDFFAATVAFRRRWSSFRTIKSTAWRMAVQATPGSNTNGIQLTHSSHHGTSEALLQFFGFSLCRSTCDRIVDELFAHRLGACGNGKPIAEVSLILNIIASAASSPLIQGLMTPLCSLSEYVR